MKSERPGWRAGAGSGRDDGKGVTANIALPDPPDNQELDRVLAALRDAVPRLRTLALIAGTALGAATGLAGCLWVHLP